MCRILLNKKRKTVGLGDFDQAAAVIAKADVEHLIGQHSRDRPPNDKTSAWLDTLPLVIHNRLAALELVAARKRCELPRTVLAFMREYIKGRTDWKKPENHKQTFDHLEGFLKGDVPLTG